MHNTTNLLSPPAWDRTEDKEGIFILILGIKTLCVNVITIKNID